MRIYEKLNSVSPIDGDCGKLCEAACCTSTDPDMGIYLLPGEEQLVMDAADDFEIEVEDACEYEVPRSWEGNLYFIRCVNPGKCNRFYRPIQCKMYPLEPHMANGKLSLILSSVKTPYVCPLISKKMRLDPIFIKTVYEVWHELIDDPLIYDLVVFDSATRSPVTQVFPKY